MHMILKSLMILWQLPQVLIGRYVARGLAPAHTVSGVRIYVCPGIDGVSLGNTVIVSPDAYEGTWLVRHEFGHVVQSRVLGWLYVPAILLPSYLWYRAVSRRERMERMSPESVVLLYYTFYTERSANRLSGAVVSGHEGDLRLYSVKRYKT